MLIGYLAPGPGPGDNADRAAQRSALAQAGCEQIVEEQPDVDGSSQQLELHGLLARLNTGDVVVVPQLDSLGRSLPDVVRWAQRLAAAGICLHSLTETLDATAHNGEAAVATLDSQAAWNSQPAPQRPDAGHIAKPDTRRRAAGRPPKLSLEQRVEIVEEVVSGRGTAAGMARRYGVSEATISRMLAASRAGVLVPAANGQAGKNAAHADLIAGVLPVSALDERLAIVGTSGSGKTYAAKGLLERVMAGGGRVCVVDPLGVWWGLRAAPDGAAPPFPVTVFGGLHADVPLTPGMAAALGQLVGTHALACVVDVSDFASAADQRLFMTVFTKALYMANTEPLHLVLDEADLWAPQRVQPGGHDLLGRVEEIVRRGRVRGFVPWLITQRPAVLHKDVLSQADILLSMKLTSSQDRDAIGRWIEGQADRAEGRRILGALPRLARGEGWVWAPGNDVLARMSFPRIRTLDSSQTPRREMLAGAPRALAALDPSAIRAMLAGMAVEASDE